MVYDIWFNILRSCIVAGALNLESDIHTLHDMSKQIIRLLQCLCIVGSTDKELATISIRARISHSHAALSVISLHGLVVELIAWSACTIAEGVTGLDNKMRNDTVKFQSIIEMMLRQEHEVIDGLRCQLRVKF